MPPPEKRQFKPFTAISHSRASLVSWFGQPDKFRVSSRDGLNATLVKPANGVLLGWHLVNQSIGWRQLNFYDQATEPNQDGPVDWVLAMPPESPSTAEFALQIPFYNGIAFTITAWDGRPVTERNVEGMLLYA